MFLPQVPSSIIPSCPRFIVHHSPVAVSPTLVHLTLIAPDAICRGHYAVAIGNVFLQ